MNLIVSGTFDLLHEGHMDLFEFAQLIPHQRFVILVNGDEKLKNEKVVEQDEIERLQGVEAFCDNYGISANIFIGSTKDECLSVFEAYAPCFLLHGNDHNVKTLSKIYGVEEDWWNRKGIYLLYKDRYPGVSSTEKRMEL